MSANSTIIDIHCHIASEMFFPPSFFAGIVENFAASLAARGVAADRRKIARMYSTILQDPMCDELVREMDAAGIAESVLLLPDFTFALRDGRFTIAEMIEHHRVVLARHPGRLRAFVGVDPRWGRDGLTLFETAIRDYGFCGMKLYPPCGYAPDDKALYPFYEICAQLSLPVLVHIGATSPVLPFGFAQPLLIDRAALDFPGVDFILAHGTVHYQDECAMLCTNRPNVYLDISGFEMRDASHMRATFDRAINHKVLFGTDWPIFRLQGRQKQFVDRLREDSSWRPASMSAADVDLLFHGNAARLLGRRQVPRPAVGPVIAPLAAGDGE